MGTDYVIEEGSTAEEVAEAVRRYMARGYRPIGGVVVTVNEYGSLLYSQALSWVEAK